jgi:acyl-CoA reductase-like NAD-dependent aldehyde dehydrogenase
VIKLKDLDSPLWKEEVFGPVVALTSYRTEEEALKLANDSEYGLSAMVIGKNTANAEKFASKIESGMVYVNSMNRATPDLPFGGCKNSGYGREGGEHGFESFANVQTFYAK